MNDDFVQFDINDSIYNGTLKTLAMFEWIGEILKLNSSMHPDNNVKVKTFKTPIILKINDRSLVNAASLLSLVSDINLRMRTNFLSADSSIYGSIIRQSHLERNPMKKLYVPATVLQSDKLSFDYLSGNGYILTLSIMEKILQLRSNCFKTILFIEDVFITGFLVDKLHVKLASDHRIYTGDETPRRPLKSKEYRNYAVIAEISSLELLSIWAGKAENNSTNATEPQVDCSRNNQTKRSEVRKSAFCNFYRTAELPRAPRRACQESAETDSFTYR